MIGKEVYYGQQFLRARNAEKPIPQAQGLGLTSYALRVKMVDELRQRGIVDEAVLNAMLQVDRSAFIEDGLKASAYREASLPIGWEQTISKPSTVAITLQALRSQIMGTNGVNQLGIVLEIGTGCGYQTALLAKLARVVVSVERIAPLVALARKNLTAQKVKLIYERQLSKATVEGVVLLNADGRKEVTLPAGCYFDAIVAAAVAEEVPPVWFDVLHPQHGVLVCPLGSGEQQRLAFFCMKKGMPTEQTLQKARFVPLKSGVQN